MEILCRALMFGNLPERFAKLAIKKRFENGALATVIKKLNKNQIATSLNNSETSDRLEFLKKLRKKV